MKKIIIFIFLIALTSTSNSQTEFSQENAERYLRKLTVDIGPRPMGSPAEQQALAFAVEKFGTFGCDSAYVMPMTYTNRFNTSSDIAVGIKKGKSNRIIVIGGHIDTNGPEIPGADDNGSGAAVVLEAARVLCTKDLQSTFVFTLFGGEEQGLCGSEYFVDFFPHIESVMLMLQIDMANGLGKIEIDTDTYGKSSPKWLVKAAIEEFYDAGYEHLSYSTHAQSINNLGKKSAGSDHQPFLDAGIPAIAFITDISKPIHTPQDNISNFDPRGLKRSGDVVIKLAERFDNGVPTRQTDNYRLFLIGKTPVFFSIWMLKIFIILSVLTGIISMIIIHKRRVKYSILPPVDSLTNPAPLRRKWSGVKMILFVIIPVIFFTFAPDIMGLIKNLRFPWTSDIYLYLYYSIIFGLAGLWISSFIEKKLRLSICPYVLFCRSALILLVYLIGLSLIDSNVAVYPASALLLVSLSVVLRNQILKFALLLLSPALMFRLIFSEWYPLIKRTPILLSDGNVEIILKIGNALALFVVVIPFFFAFAAVYRETPLLKLMFDVFRKPKFLFLILITEILFSIYLFVTPSYSDEWFRTVKVTQSYNFDDDEFKINLKSSEYLNDIKIKHAYGDTVLTGKINFAKIPHEIIPANLLFDSASINIQRNISKRRKGDTTYFDVNILLTSIDSPYMLEITYKGNQGYVAGFNTEYKFTQSESNTELKWYSFSEMPLKIPVNFFVTGSDTIKERIEITYSDLFYPIAFEREKTNFIKRSIVNQNFKYFND